jgi:hypothetical protein
MTPSRSFPQRGGVGTTWGALGWLPPGGVAPHHRRERDACRWPPPPVLREPPLSFDAFRAELVRTSRSTLHGITSEAAPLTDSGPGNPISTRQAACDFVKPGVGFRKSRFRNFGRPQASHRATRLILASVKRPRYPEGGSRACLVRCVKV